MSFQKRRKSSTSITGRPLGHNPQIAHTDVLYTIDVLNSAELLDCRKFIEDDVYQYMYDKYHRTEPFQPYVQILMKFDYKKHPDYSAMKECIQETRVILDFEDVPVSFTEMMDVVTEACEGFILKADDTGSYKDLITEYKVRVNYWFNGPSIDCYGDFPMLTTNMNHRLIYGKIKKALEKGGVY